VPEHTLRQAGPGPVAAGPPGSRAAAAIGTVRPGTGIGGITA
jgi:hypothetical protein